MQMLNRSYLLPGFLIKVANAEITTNVCLPHSFNSKENTEELQVHFCFAKDP